MRVTITARLLLLAVPAGGVLLAACDPALCPPVAPAADRGTTVADTRTADRRTNRPEAGASPRYSIELTGSHSHIYKTVVMKWTVRDTGSCTDPGDLKTCTGVPGLPVVAVVRPPGGKPPLEQPLETGKLEDNGDGTYAQTRSFGLFGAYAVGLRFEKDGQTYGTFYPYETSRGGGEKYFCDTDQDGKPDHAFQVRWNASVEGIVADDSTEVTFLVELMRSFNTPIDTTSPWTNLFDHLRPGQLGGGPAVRLMADKGAAATPVQTLSPVYKGKGIYEMKRKFAAAELGGQAERTFWLEVSFTDELGCAVKGSMDPEEYYFPVGAKK